MYAIQILGDNWRHCWPATLLMEIQSERYMRRKYALVNKLYTINQSLICF